MNFSQEKENNMEDFFGQELHEELDLEDMEIQEEETGVMKTVVWEEEENLEEETGITKTVVWEEEENLEEELEENFVGEDQPKTKLVLKNCLKALYPEGRPLVILKAGSRVEIEEEKDGWTKLKKGGYVRSSNLGD